MGRVVEGGGGRKLELAEGGELLLLVPDFAQASVFSQILLKIRLRF